MPLDVVELLLHPAGRDPALPALTFLDAGTGERTEVSGRTLALWVAKTANLLRDGLDVTSGQVVAVRLPCHWQSWAIVIGAWASGCIVDVADQSAALPPDAPAAFVPAAQAAARQEQGWPGDLVTLALLPLARPGPPPPPMVVDYDVEIRTYGDRFAAGPDAVAQLREFPSAAGARLDLEAAALDLNAAPDDAGSARMLTTLAPSSRDNVLAVATALRAGAGVVLLAHPPEPDDAGHRDGAASAALMHRLRAEGVTRATPEARHLLAAPAT